MNLAVPVPFAKQNDSNCPLREKGILRGKPQGCPLKVNIMVTDPTANMLTIIKNGYMAKKLEVLAPLGKHKLAIAKILSSRQFVGNVEKENNKIKIGLVYENQRPKIHDIKKVSKPGLRIYVKSKNIKKVKGGKGLVIVSTPKGVMTGEDAKAKKLGGEIICEVW